MMQNDKKGKKSKACLATIKHCQCSEQSDNSSDNNSSTYAFMVVSKHSQSLSTWKRICGMLTHELPNI